MIVSHKHYFRKTKRLTIRSLNKNDYNAWKKAYTTILPQKNFWDRTTNRPLIELTKSKFNALLKEQSQKRKTEEFCDYGIFLNNSGEYIGRISLMNFVRSVTQSSFVGYTLFNPHWGRGYAEEALKAIVDIAFKDHKLHRIVAGIEPQNKRSHKLVKKLKFRKEGTSKKVVFLRGAWQDLVQYALTTEDVNLKWLGKIKVRKQ